MTYTAILLGAASVALAYSPLSSDTIMEPLSPFPSLSASGTGYYPSNFENFTAGVTGTYPTATAIVTGYSGLQSTFSSGSGRPRQSSEPIRLEPYVHPDTDRSDPENIRPNTKQTLHYQEGQRRAQVDFDFHNPTVQLEYISDVKDITCPSDNEIHVSFDSEAPFEKATADWPNSGNAFNLIDNTEGCGKSGHRTFFLIQSYDLDKETRSFRAKGRALSATDPELAKGFKAEWGHVRSTSTYAHTSMITDSPKQAKRFDLPDPGDLLSKFESHVGDIVSEGEGEFSTLKSKAEDLLPTGAFSKATTIDVDIGPTGTKSPSPWGDAVNMQTVDDVTVWCIDCGMHGDIILDGSISVGLSDPILTAGFLDVQAQEFKVPMHFGFQAENAKLGRKSFTFTILDIGIPGFSIPDIFVVGPQFTLGVSFTLALSATGNLEAGVNMEWPDAKAHMDLVNDDPSASTNDGWTPTVDKFFNVSDGKMAVNASLGVPLGIGIGISIANGKFNKSIAITDTPNIELDSIFNTDGNQPDKRSHPRKFDLIARQEIDQCTNGIEEIVKFNDIVGLNVLDLWKTQLTSWGTTVFSTCIETASDPETSTGAPSTTPAETAVGVTTSAGTAPIGTASGGPLYAREDAGAPFPAGQRFNAIAARSPAPPSPAPTT